MNWLIRAQIFPYTCKDAYTCIFKYTCMERFAVWLTLGMWNLGVELVYQNYSIMSTKEMYHIKQRNAVVQ